MGTQDSQGNRRARPLATLLFIVLAQLGVLAPARPAIAVNAVEEFSLVGWTAAHAAELAVNIMQLGAAQASLQEEIAAARRDFQAAWSDEKRREEAGARLGKLLHQKDILYAALPIAEGVNEGWERSKALNRFSGSPLDGGIAPEATMDFLIWIVTLRGHLGVYADDHLMFALASRPEQATPALEKSHPAYLRYARSRDRAELGRFLPPPAPRVAPDGSAAFEEQRIDALNPFGIPVDQRHDIGTRLRAVADRGQQMLECVYGPVRAHHPERGEITVHRTATFWYRSVPADIQGLRNADQHGKLAELGDKPLDRCPASWKQAQAVQAANVARHPFTVRRQEQKKQMNQECGNDRNCMRRRAAGR